MIGILFLKPQQDDRLSRLINKAFELKYGKAYLGFTHAVVQYGAMVSEITTQGIFTVEFDDPRLVERIGAFAEFELESGIEEMEAELRTIKRVQKELEDGDTLIEDELIDWYFDDSLDAYTCVSFVLQMLGINNVNQNLDPQQLFLLMQHRQELFKKDFAQGNGLDATDVNLLIGARDVYIDKYIR